MAESGGPAGGAAAGTDPEAAQRAAAAASRAATGARMLKDGQLDELGRAVLFLARELWVTRDRLAVLEAVLDARGLDVAQAVADHRPSPELAARLATERKALVEGLMATLCPAEEGMPTS
jgi:hypothetical protein